MDSITLTRDELYVFLALLGMRTISGLPQNLVDGLADEEAEARFNGGEWTLQARGLLRYAAEQRPVPHALLVALVGTAALPVATLMLQQVEPGARGATHFFSRRPGLLVEHWSPRPGLYAFQLVADDNLRERVAAITAPLSAEAAAAVEGETCWSIHADSMADFLNRSATGDAAGAAAALVQGGLPQPAARDMAAGLRSRPHWIAAGGRQINGVVTATAGAAMLIGGEVGCWLVESAGAGQVHIYSAGGAACQERLLALAGDMLADTEQEGEDAQLAAELD